MTNAADQIRLEVGCSNTRAQPLSPHYKLRCLALHEIPMGPFIEARRSDRARSSTIPPDKDTKAKLGIYLTLDFFIFNSDLFSQFNITRKQWKG